MPKIKGNILVWDEQDWLGGLHQQYLTSTGGLQRQENKIASMRSTDPYRNLGYLTPGFLAADVTDVAQVTSILRKGVVNGTTGYIISEGPDLHQFTVATGAITNAGTFPHTIAAHGGHATVIGDDCVIYDANVSSTLTKQVFYSWNDNTDGDVGIYNIGAGTFNDDYLSTVPAGAAALTLGVAHPLVVGKDDILYIGNGNVVDAFDGQTGADGTLSAAVLTLPEDYEITAFAKTDVYLVVFAYRQTAGGSFNLGEATAFFWDYLSNDPTLVIDLNDNFVSEAFEWRGTVGCFTQGRRTNPTSNAHASKIQLYNPGTGQFETLTSFTGNAPIRGGVAVTGEIIQFNSAGNLFQWGTAFEGKPDVLVQTAEGDGTSEGMFLAPATAVQLISTGTTTSGGLQTLNGNFFATSFVEGSFAEPVFSTGKKGRLKEVKVRFRTAVSGGRAIRLLVQDRLGNQTNIFGNSTNLTTINSKNIAKVDRWTETGDPLPEFDAIKPVFVWKAGSGATTAPVIAQVEFHFEEVNA